MEIAKGYGTAPESVLTAYDIECVNSYLEIDLWLGKPSLINP